MAQRDLFLEPIQARPQEPTDYENALAEALESAFSQNIDELPQIVGYLNENGPASPLGMTWTEETFTTETFEEEEIIDIYLLQPPID